MVDANNLTVLLGLILSYGILVMGFILLFANHFSYSEIRALVLGSNGTFYANMCMPEFVVPLCMCLTYPNLFQVNIEKCNVFFSFLGP